MLDLEHLKDLLKQAHDSGHYRRLGEWMADNAEVITEELENARAAAEQHSRVMGLLLEANKELKTGRELAKEVREEVDCKVHDHELKLCPKCDAKLSQMQKNIL